MKLEALLSAHVATDEKEAADLQRMREWARTLSQPFSRSEPAAHFTGSAVIVTPDGERVLLIHHGKLNRWLQPGGHAEPGDEGDLERTALREARGETGLEVEFAPRAPRPLDVDIHEIPARKTEPAHHHLDVRFLFVAKDPERLAHEPNESHGAQWLTWTEAVARADEPALTRLLLKSQRWGQGK
jgi:8-oxo-dGTP pyrophosphatase MutT (NUDIX family)